MNNFKLKLAVSIALMTALSGCSILGGGNQELRSWIQQIKDKPSKQLPEVPGPPEYDKFAFEAHDLRDPFQPYRAVRPQESNQVRPDSLRNKEPLEEFTLDSLTMVGVLNNQALILDPNGVTHKLGLGRYLGKNDGRITKIEQEKVSMIELVSDTMGGWEEKQTFIMMKD